MWKYILKRILWLIVIMLCVAVVIFVILWFVPGDPAQIVLGTGATQADIERQREIMGLNAPFIVQLGRYLRDVFLHFDFGNSYVYGTPVINEFVARLPRTLGLGLISMASHIVIGIPLGVNAAIHRNSFQDQGLLIMAMFAYAISRKGFMLGKFLSVYLLIPMLFSGGQLSCYIIYTSMYGLKDNIALLILPLCVSTMNVIILRTYIVNSIPGELMEAAKIDGAGEYRTFFQITLPLLKPSIAAVGFMMATVYWNDWQNALLYITSDSKKPLQLLLINIQKSIEFLLNNTNVPASVKAAMGGTIPQYSATMATVIIVIGPIMVIYPFFQKYFVKGLTVGSVKG